MVLLHSIHYVRKYCFQTAIATLPSLLNQGYSDLAWTSKIVAVHLLDGLQGMFLRHTNHSDVITALIWCSHLFNSFRHGSPNRQLLQVSSFFVFFLFDFFKK